MRNRAEKRHNDWKKAIRKRRIVKEVYCWNNELYDNLHQYSKNKVHCSCPFCRAKTAKKWQVWNSGKNWSVNDERRIEEMKDQILDNEENF